MYVYHERAEICNTISPLVTDQSAHIMELTFTYQQAYDFVPANTDIICVLWLLTNGHRYCNETIALFFFNFSHGICSMCVPEGICMVGHAGNPSQRTGRAIIGALITKQWVRVVTGVIWAF